MIIDFHTHIFPDKIAQKTVDMLASGTAVDTPAFNGTADGLIEVMDRADASICINLPAITKPTQFENVANFAIGINEKYKDSKRRIISFGGIHPDCEDIEKKMQFLKDNGILGVKIHPDYQNTLINDPKYVKILEVAKDLDMIVVTHSGVDNAYRGKSLKCSPELVKELIKKVNHKKFILGHYGAHEQWEETLDMLAGLDVYFDTAYTFNTINEELFTKILNKHGEDKVLFATDCPWQDIKQNVDVLRSYNLKQETKDKILYKNALKLLNI